MFSDPRSGIRFLARLKLVSKTCCNLLRPRLVLVLVVCGTGRPEGIVWTRLGMSSFGGLQTVRYWDVEMKAIIHIGMMKTGTTSIQQWLRSNHTALEAVDVHSSEGVFREFRGRYRRTLRYAAFQTALNEFGVNEKTA